MCFILDACCHDKFLKLKDLSWNLDWLNGLALVWYVHGCEFKTCWELNNFFLPIFPLAWMWKGLENLVAKKAAVSAGKIHCEGYWVDINTHFYCNFRFKRLSEIKGGMN